jgi:hypothetical protein
MQPEKKHTAKSLMIDNFRAVSWTLLPLGVMFVLFVLASLIDATL